MSEVSDPEYDLPRDRFGNYLRGGSDIWDQPQASVILDADYFEAAGVGGQNLTATRYSNTSTFGAHTVTVGAVTLTATLYVNGDSFGSATVSQGGGPQSLTGTLYADPDAFGAATVAATYSLTATRFSDADTFGSPTVTPGAVTLTATRYADGDTFGAAAVSQSGGGAQSLAATIFEDSDSFGAATITAADVAQEVRQPGGFAPIIYVDRNGRAVDLKRAAEKAAEQAPKRVQNAVARVVPVIQDKSAAVTEAIARDMRTIVARLERLDADLAAQAAAEFARIRAERLDAEFAAIVEAQRLQADEDEIVTILLMAA